MRKRSPKQVEWEAERLRRSTLPYNKLYLGIEGEYWHDGLNYLVVPVGAPVGDQTHCVLVSWYIDTPSAPWKVQILTQEADIVVDDVFEALAKVMAIRASKVTT